MANKKAALAAMSAKTNELNKKAEQEIGSPKKGFDIRSITDKVSGYLDRPVPGHAQDAKKRTKIFEETVAEQMKNQGKYGRKYIIDENTGKKTYLQD